MSLEICTILLAILFEFKKDIAIKPFNVLTKITNVSCRKCSFDFNFNAEFLFSQKHLIASKSVNLRTLMELGLTFMTGSAMEILIVKEAKMKYRKTKS